MKTDPTRIQTRYYQETAASYDQAHTADNTDEHYAALALMDGLSEMLNLNSFLDVGAGTGRGIRYLLAKGKTVSGIEPVPELIHQARLRGVPANLMVQGNGAALPFKDNSFDAVFECGVLHHVAEPAVVVSEMMRVARKAVFISDSNRFGQGPRFARLLKLILSKTRLWRAARFIQTRGKMYMISEGDGLWYSYSVFDSYDQLAPWADRIWIFATDDCRLTPPSWSHTLLNSRTALLCAIKI